MNVMHTKLLRDTYQTTREQEQTLKNLKSSLLA